MIHMIVNAVIWLLSLHLLIIHYRTLSCEVLMMVWSVLRTCQWYWVILTGVYLKIFKRCGGISERLFSREDNQQNKIM